MIPGLFPDAESVPVGAPMPPMDVNTTVSVSVSATGDAATSADIPKAAVKFDQGKVRWDLVPWDAIEQLAILYTVGAMKYADNNWLKGFRFGRTFAAMMRHFIKWWLAKLRGEDGIDYENAELYHRVGLQPQSHLVAVVWNAVALLTFDMRKLGEDDRPTK